MLGGVVKIIDYDLVLKYNNTNIQCFWNQIKYLGSNRYIVKTLINKFE